MEINTFQMFTRNPRGWQFAPLSTDHVNAFRRKLAKVDVSPVFVHMPYLPNLASPRSHVYTLSVQSLTEELRRCNELNVPFLVTHMGSNLGSGKAAGIRRITDAINKAFSRAEGEVMLLLENTAGTKNSMGSSFEDINKVIEGIYAQRRVGICVDTCHAFAAGYDLRNERSLDSMLRTLDSVLGLERLKLVHLNDSMGGLHSHIDRHEHIGLGKIGEEGFKTILSSELTERPIIMETPIDERRSDWENLTKVRELANL